uniref:NADH dehydrogenase subunit 6 n=1 Tax=Ruditapes variegatus TaxID=291252 RepID=UPI002176A29E|nr:NADH dehydrogenase subunit 6 [Ruditapes variegatus]UUA63029.1 NADH dehydrogenase subunit 6 [Ruditapes variegatus]
MLEFMVVVCCLSSVSVAERYNHPMYFGASLLLVVVFMSGILGYYGGVYSFMLFMCVASGVLVVFAYSMSLTPLILGKSEGEEFVKNTEDKSGIVESYFLMSMVYCFACSVLGLWALYCISSFVGVSSGSSGFSKVLYMGVSWGVGMSLMGFLLFLVMVFCVGVAGKYKGALIE